MTDLEYYFIKILTFVGVKLEGHGERHESTCMAERKSSRWYVTAVFQISINVFELCKRVGVENVLGSRS